MPHSWNLALAEMAVKFVDSAMVYGSENKRIDMEHRCMYAEKFPPSSLSEARSMRRLFDRLNFGPEGFKLNSDVRSATALDHLMGIGKQAAKDKQGNCSEQACLAAYYLIRIKRQKGVGVFALDPMTDRDKLIKELKFDHVFVVLGLNREPVQKQVLSLSADHHPSGWTNAVWCDPWAHEWFDIKEGWPRRLHDIVRMLPSGEIVWKLGIRMTCEVYYDGAESVGTLV